MLGVPALPRQNLASGAVNSSSDSSRATVESIRSLIDDGRFPAAQAAARDLLARSESVHGRDSLEAAEALDLLVEARYREENLDEEALQQARRALAIREALVPADDGRLAVSLDNLGRVLIMRGDNVAAQPICERGVALAEKASGPEHLRLAQSLSTLADFLYYAHGDYAGSAKLYERALAIRESALGPEHPKVARNLWDLAGSLWQGGDLPAARSALQRGLAIQEKTLRADHPDTADTLDMLSQIAWDVGDRLESYRLRSRAIQIAERSLGPDSARLAMRLFSMSTMEIWYRENFDEAKRLLGRVLAINEKNYGKESRQYAYGLTEYGNLLAHLGDGTEAERMLQQALSVMVKALGPEYDDVGWILRSLGELSFSRGEYSEASGYLERALTIMEKAHGPDSPHVANCLALLGQNSLAMGDFAEALAFHRQALQIYEKLDPEGDNASWALSNIADTLRDQGQFTEAKGMYEHALSIRERIYGPGHPDVGWTLKGFAESLVRGGEARRGFELALRSEEISRDHLRLTARTLPERQALGYAALRNSGLDLILSVAVHDSDPALVPEAWDAVIRSRALILDEIATRQRAAAASSDPATASLYGTLSAARQRLADLTIRGPGNDSPGQYRALLDDARAAKERAEAAFAEKSLAFRERTSRSRTGLADIRVVLPPESALVAFARYLQYDVRDTGKNAPAARTPLKEPRGAANVTAHYGALVTRAGAKESRVFDLGPVSRIDSLVDRWRQIIARDGGMSPKDLEAGDRAAGAALRRAVWDPIASHVGRSKRVFVVPDGDLHLVNLSALPIDRGRYLVETGLLVQYLSAERDLLPAAHGKDGEGMIALGGAAFDESGAAPSQMVGGKHPETDIPRSAAGPSFSGKRSTCGDFETMRFDPLPDSEREVEEVVALWRNGSERDRMGLSLTGSGASETAFKGLAPGRRMIHLATHGFYIGGACASALDASNIPAPVAANPMSPPPAIGENPLLLSGLALAGANRRASVRPGEDDGILTAEEIAAMDLSGVDWVVLSACDTGTGKFRAWEGMFGLQRAFQLAGARTVISSLWSVEDDAARAWMSDLYKAHLRGASTAAAVRDASLGMIDSLKRSGLPPRPYFWGSFIAVGY